MRPEHQLLGVAATTQDGVSVHVRATVQCHVTDPARSVVVAPSPVAATFAELETHLAREIGYTRLTDLLGRAPPLRVGPSVARVRGDLGLGCRGHLGRHRRDRGPVDRRPAEQLAG
ncbi:hypothetical protein [Aeromicrobium sp. UC242_57]|uniref:hypothetical protein n=1 Tax=Aeromicrobium sp. UC242_57 TaxID=3374624 RepID=UPI00378C1853